MDTETPVKVEPSWMELARNVSDNPAEIKWPLDQYGFTTEVRKAIKVAAGRLMGTPAKEELLIGTLMVALAHVKKRKDKDARQKAARLKDIKKAAEARMPMERFGTYNMKTETVNG